MAKKLEKIRYPINIHKFLDNPSKIADILEKALEDPNCDVSIEELEEALSLVTAIAENYAMDKDSIERRENKVRLRTLETALKARLAGFDGTFDELKTLLEDFCEENNLEFCTPKPDPFLNPVRLKNYNIIFKYKYKAKEYAVHLKANTVLILEKLESLGGWYDTTRE